MLNLLGMLTAPTPKPLYEESRHGKGGSRDASYAYTSNRRKVEDWYRAQLLGKVLSTPQLAAMRGTTTTEGAMGSLKRLAKEGKVICLGFGKRTRKYGKPPLLWTWNE